MTSAGWKDTVACRLVVKLSRIEICCPLDLFAFFVVNFFRPISFGQIADSPGQLNRL